MFSLWNVGSLLVFHRKEYTPFIVQFSILIFIATICLSIVSNLNNYLQDYYKYPQVNTLYFKGAVEDASVNTLLQFTKLLKEEYPHVKVALAKNTAFTLPEIESLHLIEMSGDYFPLASGDKISNIEEDYIYAPKHFLFNVNNTLNLFPDYFSKQGINIKKIDINNGCIFINKERCVKVKEIPQEWNGFGEILVFNDAISLSNFEEIKIDIGKCVFIPMQYSVNKLSDTNLSIGMQIDNRDNDIENILHIAEKFNLLQNQTIFSLNEELMDKKLDVYLVLRTILFLVSVSILVVMIGLIGLFNIIIEKRKHSISLSLAVGARRKDVLFELLLEISIIVIISYIFGNILAYGLFTYNKTIMKVSIEPNYYNQVLLLLVSFLFIFISFLLVKIKINKINPLEELNNLE